MAKKIAIVGAGAKAAAIVARAATLRALGSGVPEILVFEADHIASAWTGTSRFSSGYLTLCTPGEKDVGFPYDETMTWGGLASPIASALFSRFSWAAYLVATGRMSDWVDRGRNHPTHRSWASYLKWIFESAAQPVIYAKVLGLTFVDKRWQVSFEKSGKPDSVSVDGVVLTGTGRAKSVPLAPDVPAQFVLDAETFWAARTSLVELEEGTIAVAGDGGAAGTIVAWLAEHFQENDAVHIYSINPMGTLFPRGDGHAERRWFSDPTDWPLLSLEHRRKLLDRTEAGVISMRIKSIIDQAPNVAYQAGKALEARWDNENEEIVVDIMYDGRAVDPMRANYLISAIGFDSWSLLDLIDHPSVAALFAPGNEPQRRQVETDMMADLSLPLISGLPHGLHVPALAGLARGPGMGNLGSLGLMAAAVLKPYLTK